MMSAIVTTCRYILQIFSFLRSRLLYSRVNMSVRNVSFSLCMELFLCLCTFMCRFHISVKLHRLVIQFFINLRIWEAVGEDTVFLTNSKLYM